MDNLLRRISIILEIADQSTNLKGRLGKTSMQKLMFLLQEVYKVELGYRFQLYTYGPYESKIMSDLDYAESLGVLQLEYDVDRGFEITPGPNKEELSPFNKKRLLKEDRVAIDKLIVRFGGKTARELELRSTLFFLAQDDPDWEESTLLERIKAIKPKYKVIELEAALEGLTGSGILVRNN